MNAARTASICSNFDVPVIRDASYVEHAAPIGSSAANRTFQKLIVEFLELLLLHEKVLVEAFQMEAD